MGPYKGVKGWFNYWFKIKWNVRMLKLKIKWEKFVKKFDKKKPKIEKIQEKAITLVLVLLRDKETKLNYSPESFTRFLESEYAWVTLSPTGRDDFMLNIIDETRSNHSHYHEMLIPKEHAFEIMSEFDGEIERRFRVLEGVKKKVINDDLDKLINKIKVSNEKNKNS